MFQSNFGSCQNEGFPKIAMHLSAKNVEVIGGCCTLSHLEIDVLAGKIIIGTVKGIVGLTVYVLQKALHMTG